MNFFIKIDYFPYPQGGRDVQRTKRNVKDKFWNFKHPKQRKPVSWLIKRFGIVPGWDEKLLKELKQNE